MGRKKRREKTFSPPAMARTHKAATFIYCWGKNSWTISSKAFLKFISFDKAVSLLWHKKHMWISNFNEIILNNLYNLNYLMDYHENIKNIKNTFIDM